MTSSQERVYTMIKHHKHYQRKKTMNIFLRYMIVCRRCEVFDVIPQFHYQLAVDIGSEIRSQNKFIDELVFLIHLLYSQDHDVGGLRGTFKNTMGKIGEAMSLSQGSGICVLVVFMVIVFVILWRMIR